MAMYEKATSTNFAWLSCGNSNYVIQSMMYDHYNRFYNPVYGGDNTAIIDIDLHAIYSLPPINSNQATNPVYISLNNMVGISSSTTVPITLEKIDELSSPYYDGRISWDNSIKYRAAPVLAPGTNNYKGVIPENDNSVIRCALPIKNKPVGILTKSTTISNINIPLAMMVEFDFSRNNPY